MDLFKSLAGNKQQPQGAQQEQQSSGGAQGAFSKILGSGAKQSATQPEQNSSGITGKFNNLAGGGARGEQNEDALDKGVDFVQERFLGQGAQDNESAAEQAKDEAISDTIRSQYRNATGKEFPVADKHKRFG